jgi:O-antigen/teichoic acid export membrane protein
MSYTSTQLKKIFLGGGFGLIGEASFLAFSFVIVFLSVKILGPREYGIFILALTIMNILGVICKQGLHTGMLKEITQLFAQNKDLEANSVFRYSFYRTLVVSLIVCLIITISAQYFVHFFNKDPILGTYLVTLSFILPFVAMFTISLFGLQAVGRVRQMIFQEKVLKPGLHVFLLALIFVILVHFKWPLNNTFLFLGVYIFVIIATCLSTYRALKGSRLSLFHPAKRFNKREYLHFSYPLLFHGIIGLLATWTSTLMIAYFIIDPQEIGSFYVIFKISSFCVIALISLDRAFAPIIGELYYRNAREELLKIYRVVTRWALIGAFFVLVIVTLIGKHILGLFDSSYTIAYIPLIILCVSRVIDASVGSVAYILLMTGHSRIILYNSIFILLINVILNYLLIPLYGIIGAAIATAISYSIKNLMWMLFVYFKTNLQPYDRCYFKTILIFFLSLISVITLRYILPHNLMTSALNFIVFLSIFCIPYILFGIDDTDKELIQRVANRFVFKHSHGGEG